MGGEERIGGEASQSQVVTRVTTAMDAEPSSPNVQTSVQKVVVPNGENDSPHSMRITSHGSIRAFVTFALNFFEVGPTSNAYLLLSEFSADLNYRSIPKSRFFCTLSHHPNPMLLLRPKRKSQKALGYESGANLTPLRP